MRAVQWAEPPPNPTQTQGTRGNLLSVDFSLRCWNSGMSASRRDTKVSCTTEEPPEEQRLIWRDTGVRQDRRGANYGPGGHMRTNRLQSGPPNMKTLCY